MIHSEPLLTSIVTQSVSLHPSLMQDAIRAFDLASLFTKSDSETTLLLLIKAVALFNGNQHEDAMVRVQELAAVCPKADTLACRVVEAYLCILLGTNASDGGRHSEAADHFTAAVKASAFTSQLAIYSKYQDFCGALWVGSRVLVAKCKPEKVRCTPPCR